MHRIFFGGAMVLLAISLHAQAGNDFVVAHVAANTSSSIVEFRYVGSTTQIDDGDWRYQGLRGVAAMNKACVDEYGVSARAASIPEVLSTDTDVGAWLVPGRAPIVALARSNGRFVPRDSVSGIQVGAASDDADGALGAAFCSGYSNSNSISSGPITGVAATIQRASCNSIRPTACSAPVELPLQ